MNSCFKVLLLIIALFLIFGYANAAQVSTLVRDNSNLVDMTKEGRTVLDLPTTVPAQLDLIAKSAGGELPNRYMVYITSNEPGNPIGMRVGYLESPMEYDKTNNLIKGSGKFIFNDNYWDHGESTNTNIPMPEKHSFDPTKTEVASFSIRIADGEMTIQRQAGTDSFILDVWPSGTFFGGTPSSFYTVSFDKQNW